METLYVYCAAVAGTLLVLQVVVSLIGLGEHFHFDHSPDAHFDWGDHHDGFDHGGGWFVGMLSFRAVVAAVTVFGLAGLAGEQLFADSTRVFLLALTAGGAVMYGVAWIMRHLYRLKSDGTVRIERTLGQPASVYLSIPPKGNGTGKVTATLQGRTVEYVAMNASDEAISTGSEVVVTRVVGPGTVEVDRSRAEQLEGATNE